MPPGKLDAQGAGSVITYLRRYALMAILGIAAEDDDGEAAARPGPPRTPQDGQRGASPPQGARPAPQPTNPTAMASYEQRAALWSALVRACNDDKDQAEKWLRHEFSLFVPPILKPAEMSVGNFRKLMEKVAEFARSEGPQGEPLEAEPADEFGFEDQGYSEDVPPPAGKKEKEEKKDDKKKGKGK